MGFRLSIWSRDGQVRFNATGLSDEGVRSAWSKRDQVRGLGLVSLDDEPEPDCPDKRAFVLDQLLLTRRAHEKKGAFQTIPLGPRYPDLLAVRKVKLVTGIEARGKVAPDIDDPTSDNGSPVLPSDILEALRLVEMPSLTGHRSVRTALMRLDVRLGSDLAKITQGDLLAALGGDRSSLKSFQDQAVAFARRAEAKRMRQARERSERAEARGAVSLNEGLAMGRRDTPAPRNAEFRNTPLKAAVLQSLEMLPPRNAAILVRKLGLDGIPEHSQVVADAYGISQQFVRKTLELSIAELDRIDGWPTRLKRLAREVLPATVPELRRLPCFEGLGIEQVVALTWIGTGERINVIDTSTGPVVGHMTKGEWRIACIKAREVVRTVGLDIEPERFQADLRACLPDRAEGYETFLRMEIGCGKVLGDDWLLRLKARVSASHLIRDVTNHLPAMVGTAAMLDAVEAYVPETSTPHLRRAIRRSAKQASGRRAHP